MGRRAARRRRAVKRQGGMLGWGLFIALLVGLFAPRMGVRPVATIAVAATAVVVFGLLWALSGRDADDRREAAGSPQESGQGSPCAERTGRPRTGDEADTKRSAPVR